MRNYALNPSRYHSHLHEAHLHLTDTLLRERELHGLLTHIGKVKSHTGVRYNDMADEAARAVVAEDISRRSLNLTKPTHPSADYAHGLKPAQQNQTNRMPSINYITSISQSRNKHVTNASFHYNPESSVPFSNKQENLVQTTAYTPTPVLHTDPVGTR
jgi:hypothetical protein